MLTQQEKVALKKTIDSNKHEIFVVSMEEMDAIIRSSPNSKKSSIQESWTQIKDKLGAGANYGGSAGDVAKLSKLVGDLGSFGARVYVKTYGGNPHIILKGRPGLRKVLTGTKYGIKNPKVVKMGLGKTGAIKAAKGGGVLTVVLLSVYRLVDYFLTDDATLSRLIGTLATDVVKVGIATGASIAGAAALGMATFAVGPIVAVIVIGLGVTMLLDSADQHYGITEKVVAGVDELGESTQAYIEQTKRQIQKTGARAAESVIDYAIESAQRIVVKWVSDQLNQFISPVSRVR